MNELIRHKATEKSHSFSDWNSIADHPLSIFPLKFQL